MSWNLISQCVIFVVSAALLVQFLRLHFQATYRALFLYAAFNCFQSLLLITYRGSGQRFDYRLLYCPLTWLTWGVSIWMVYSLLISILKSLPGILRFSLWFLNCVFLIWIAISLATFASGYAIYNPPDADQFLTRLTAVVQVLDGRFVLAELLVVISVLIFVLRFPIRVPRNLAVFGVGVVAVLLVQGVVMLLFNFLPEVRALQAQHGLVKTIISSIPSFVIAFCFGYWVFALSKAGEHASATLGREWQSVPKEHLVRQLEAMNAALLRSRENV